MTQELKIGGYTIAELTKLQNAIKQDASAVIADAVSDASDKVSQILALASDGGDEDTEVDIQEVDKLGASAAESLKLAKLISGISGVEYYLPYNEEYCDNDETMHPKLEEIYGSVESNGVDELMSILEDMEHQSYLWNSSSIGC